MYLLSAILKSLVREGHLSIIDSSGQSHDFGEMEKPALSIRLADRVVECALLIDPQLAFGEAYMDGRLTVENGDIADALELLTRNLGLGFGNGHWKWLAFARRWTRRLAQPNSRRRATRNAEHHYNLSGELYDLFLDSEKQYSCAFFEKPGDTLETAQLQKQHRIAKKLDLKSGQHLLDIGSGWGGLALYFAQAANVDVTGITLSNEQLKIANERANALGLSNRVHFLLQDYRQAGGRFDRVVSVGMLEHVGIGQYQDYFKNISALLSDNGVALIHAIGRSDGPGFTNPWIGKYIFPGGYTPALSEVLPAVEQSGLIVTDVEILRLHYAYTLAEWRRRFRANWDRAKQIYDERFCRMWEFYLASAEMGFRNQGLTVFQLQLAKRIDLLPLTREYMMPTQAEFEQRKQDFSRDRRVAA